MAKESAPAVTDEAFFMAIIEQLGGTSGIDWQTVADKCKIVSKGAAGKRWSRLKLKYGQEAGAKLRSSDASPIKSGTPAVADGEEKTPKTQSAKKKESSKKRKAADPAEEDGSAAGQKRVKAEEEEENDGGS
ncbi:hypothetical protein B0A55_02130 [Friedmanniomyces simplex]|uniref:Myb-like DNA-binding domain-containing protein n=1 Tax=Friedmanniomyces simplex TaxID=329884 RepID=A0A4U0XL97_9PEZI|nr:hypothetical protein B0A55_02130 [Friedmanniomyces simplex]